MPNPIEGLPDEITGANGVQPIGKPTDAEIAAEVESQRRKEEARAFAAIEARKNGQTLNIQQSQTHTPDEGAAANPPGATPPVPAIPPMPNAQAQPDVSSPTSLKANTPTPVASGQPKPRQLTDLSKSPLQPLDAASANVEEKNKALSAATTEVGAQEAANLSDESQLRREQVTEANVMSGLNKLDLADADSKVSALREEAQNKGFTGFFEGKGGTRRLILGSIAQMLGAVSFDSNHVNQVTKQLDDTIAADFKQQEADHAELWKSVSTAIDQRQMLSRDQLNQMAEFRARQAMALEAVITRGKEMSALSKNKEGIAAVEANNARLGFERDKAIDEAKRLWIASNEKERHDKAEEGIERSKVAVEREKAAGGAGGAPTKAEKAFEAIYAKDEALVKGTARSPGPLARLEAVQSVRQELRDAIASRDPIKIKAAVASAREQSSRLLTGAAPTSTTVHLITEMQGSLDQLVSKASTIANNPTEGKHFVKAIETLTGGIEEQQKAILRSEKSNQEKKYAALPFVAKSAEMKAAAKARIDATFDILNRSEGGGSAPPGWQDTGRTSGGKPVYQNISNPKQYAVGQ